ncbi:AMP-binding protein [Parasporobacterium paucivorans]|uniref:Acetyl-CoA synthetase n=1 Tax=Parasporobacterium paucivorans DSM 15970 TaxID=1122934 RepID=A0A1M6IFN9_9FIRM|nr:AMP-binding protein [Parasporobacterium paucivorans]SHJ33262.1 acetyl-CoA synthetase [Parasporobacterium paucivorans DSM 15970]
MAIEIYKKYMEEKMGADGNVESCKLSIPDKFNFSYDVVDKIAEMEPQRRAMVWCNEQGERREFTFCDIKEQSDRAASYFRSLGIGKGDCVMMAVKRHYQFWFAILGLHKIGAIGVPVTYMLKLEEYIYRFEKLDIKAVICTPDNDVASRVDEAEQMSGKKFMKIILRENRPGWHQFDEGLEKAEKFVPLTFEERPESGDTMLLYFTSGTEGMPKLVGHNFGYPVGHIPTAKYWHNVDPDGLHFTVADTGWAKSVWGKLYGQWLMGAAIYVLDYDSFTAHALLTKMEEDKITTLCAPSAFYRVMVLEDFSKYNLSTVKHYTVAGEALNPDVIEKFSRMTGKQIYEGYGQTESTLMIGVMHWMDVKAGAMGKPSLQYNMELLDEDGQIVPTGDVGEICVKAEPGEIPGMFLGYQGEDELNRSKWHDGIYHTGDLAWRDENGYYWFVGRNDDVFKSSGYRISPFEIESLIVKFPNVLECAVIGVPEKLRGNAIKAIIVLTNGTEPTQNLKIEIREFLKEHTAPYKVPRIIEFVDELPKTTSGKIRRNIWRK